MADIKVVAVFGATGAQGGSVVKYLLEDPRYKVRALTRKVDSPKAKSLKQQGAEVVAADVDDKGSLKQALQGAYGVFLVTNFWEHGDEEREVKQGQNAIDAAKEAGVKYLVYSGLENVKSIMGFPVPHFDAKGRVEEYLKGTGIPFAVVRMPAYFENFLIGNVPTKVDPCTFCIDIPMANVPLDGISVAEMGMIVREVFNKPDEFSGQTVGLSADRLTLDQYVDVFNRQLAPKMFVNSRIRVDEFKAIGFPGSVELGDMFEFYQKGNPVRDKNLCRTMCPNLSTFEQFVAANKEAFNKVCQ